MIFEEYVSDLTYLATKPIVIHNRPEDYGLTKEETDKMRMAYLKKELALREDEYSYYKTCLINGNIFFDYTGLNNIQKKIRSIEYHLKSLSGETSKVYYDIEEIKKIPLDTITGILSSGFFVKNPFRNEGSPSDSLFWYKNSNRWYDFGTGKHGDIIDLYMAINSCNISQALKSLS